MYLLRRFIGAILACGSLLFVWPAAMAAIRIFSMFEHRISCALGGLIAVGFSALCWFGSAHCPSSVRQSSRQIPQAQTSALAIIVLATTLTVLMIISLFQPFLLPSYGSIDASSHISQYAEYIQTDTVIYEGFVALYSLWWILEHLFEISFINVLPISLAMVVVFSFFTVFTLSLILVDRIMIDQVAKSSAQRIGWLGFAALLVGFLAIRAAAPIMNYNLGEGFWAHHFSFLPWALLLLTAFCIQDPWIRLLVSCGFVGLTRFTYGLNLGELFIALAATAWTPVQLSLPHKTKHHRILLTIGGLSLLTAGICYWKLAGIIGVNGGIYKYPTLPLIPGLFGVVIGIVLCIKIALGDQDLPATLPLRHLLIFLFTLGLPTAIIFGAVYQLVPNHEYYYFKYPMNFAFFSIICLPPLFCFGIAKIKSQTLISKTGAKQLILGFGAAALAIMASDKLTTTYGKFFNLYANRWLNPKSLNRMDDVAIFREIQAITQRQGSSKSLLLDQHYGLTNFANVSLLSSQLGRSSVFVSANTFENGADLPQPGWCHYWFTRSPWTPTEMLFPKLEQSIEKHKQQENRACDSKERFEICHVCRP